MPKQAGQPTVVRLTVEDGVAFGEPVKIIKGFVSDEVRIVVRGSPSMGFRVISASGAGEDLSDALALAQCFHTAVMKAGELGALVDMPQLVGVSDLAASQVEAAPEAAVSAEQIARIRAQERERLAQLWDGCQYEDVGSEADIGASLRRSVHPDDVRVLAASEPQGDAAHAAHSPEGDETSVRAERQGG